METTILFLHWVFSLAFPVMILVILYLVFILVLMGLSINRQEPRDSLGRIQFKENFILRNMYKLNFIEAYKNKKIPRSICQLSWGLAGGSLFMLLVILIICCIYFIALFLGFRTRINNEEGGLMFSPYKRFGKKWEKKMWFAPWEGSLLFLVGYIFYEVTSFFMQANFVVLAHKVVESDFPYRFLVFLAIAGVWAIFILISKLLKAGEKPFFIPIKELFIAGYHKMCPEIVVIRSNPLWDYKGDFG